MRIWIDADACPKIIKQIIFKSSDRLNIEVYLVANKTLTTPPSPLIKSILVEPGPDQADHYIIEHVKPEDLVITADIPLAAAIIEKSAMALNPRGEEYTPENIREKVSIRDFMQEIRDCGGQTGGPPQLCNKDKQRFANALDKTLTKLLKK